MKKYPLHLYPFSPMVTSGQTIVQVHNHDIVIDSLDTEHFLLHKDRVSFSQHPRQPLTTTSLFSISVMVPFQVCYINGIIQYLTFGDFFFLLSIIPWRFTQVGAWICINNSFYIGEQLSQLICATLTNCHRLYNLQLREIYFPQFWSLKVQCQDASMVMFL